MSSATGGRAWTDDHQYHDGDPQQRKDPRRDRQSLHALPQLRMLWTVCFFAAGSSDTSAVNAMRA